MLFFVSCWMKMDTIWIWCRCIWYMATIWRWYDYAIDVKCISFWFWQCCLLLPVFLHCVLLKPKNRPLASCPGFSLKAACDRCSGGRRSPKFVERRGPSKSGDSKGSLRCTRFSLANGGISHSRKCRFSVFWAPFEGVPCRFLLQSVFVFCGMILNLL